MWDGARYHLAYVAPNGTDSDIVLRTVSTSGALGAPTVVAGGVTYANRSPSLAYDGAHLLLAYLDASGSGQLEVRDPSDESMIESDPIAGAKLRVDANPETGEGALLYVRGGTTYLRDLSF